MNISRYEVAKFHVFSFCYPKGCATPSFVPCQGNTWRPLEQAQEDTSPRKINVTSKLPVGSISDVTLIRTDTTLDHSQKAEKVCFRMSVICAYVGSGIWKLSSISMFLSLHSLHPVPIILPRTLGKGLLSISSLSCVLSKSEENLLMDCFLSSRFASILHICVLFSCHAGSAETFRPAFLLIWSLPFACCNERRDLLVECLLSKEFVTFFLCWRLAKNILTSSFVHLIFCH